MKHFTVRTIRATLAVAAFTVLSTSFGGVAQAASKEEELLQRERDAGQAWVKSDAKFIAALEADEYVFTSFDGSVSSKAADLASLKSGASGFESISFDDMKAMVFGDVGVVTYSQTLKGKYLADEMTGTFRATDTFVKRDGRWQVVASQMTRVAKP